MTYEVQGEYQIPPKPNGDLVWIESQERKAHFRIVWVRESESEHKTQAAVHKVENEKCPWAEILHPSQLNPAKRPIDIDEGSISQK